MMLSPGKYRGLSRLADGHGRFKMLAVDQRPPIEGPIRAVRACDVAPWEDVAAFKRMLVEELQGEASAVLLDPHYAYPASIRMLDPKRGLILTLEDSIFEETPGGRLSQDITNWSVEKIKRAGGDAVKVLTWYRPDAEASVVRHQQDYVKRIGEACARFDIPFVLELLVYPLAGDAEQTKEYVEMRAKRADHVLKSVETYASPDYGVDLFKLESPIAAPEVPGVGNPGWEDTQALFDEMGRLAGMPWVMLSAGASMADFRKVLTHAYKAGASGYLAGRAIWLEAFKAFPDWEEIRRRLRKDALPYMRELNTLTDEQATPWGRPFGVRRLRCRYCPSGRVLPRPLRGLRSLTMARLGILPLARPTFDVPFAEATAAKALAALGASGHEIVGSRELLFDADATEKALRQLKAEALDLLLLLQVTFTDASMTAKIAATLDAPLAIWAFPEPRTGGRLRLNSFCGLNLAGHALGLAGRDFGYLYAVPDAPGIGAALTEILAGGRRGTDARPARSTAPAGEGAAIVDKIRGARIGRLGEHPAGFDTCDYSDERLQALAGISVEPIELKHLFDLARAAPQDAVDAARAIAQSDVAGLSEVNAEELDRSLRLKSALDQLREAGRYSAFAVRCWPETFTEYGGAVCGPVAMMGERRVPCACEADVYGALTSLILQEAAGAPAFLVDVVDIDAQAGTSVVWHCGQAPISMHDPDVQPHAAIHSNRRMPLLYEFPLKPGRITLARVSQARGEQKLVIAGGEMVRAPLPFSGTAGTMRTDAPARTLLDTIVGSALEHHVALVYGDVRDKLRAVASALDLPVLEIG